MSTLDRDLDFNGFGLGDLDTVGQSEAGQREVTTTQNSQETVTLAHCTLVDDVMALVDLAPEKTQSATTNLFAAFTDELILISQ